VETPRLHKDSCDDWEELVVCFKKIELDNLSKLKAPTKAFYDGAPITLKTFKDETYKSQVLIMVFLKKY
jgi:hypothetical protein